MYDKSKYLSKNMIKAVSYLGKDTAILSDRIYFNSFEIKDNSIICKNVALDNKSNNIFKIISMLKFITALANSNKNIYEKSIILFKAVGFPKKYFNGFKNNCFIIDSSIISDIKLNLDIFKNINSKKIKDINELNSKFPISFSIKKSQTQLNNHIMIPTSDNVFCISWYCYTLFSTYSIFDNCFICSECGNVFNAHSNSQKFCKTCSEKIDFPSISKLKYLKKS